MKLFYQVCIKNFIWYIIAIFHLHSIDGGWRGIFVLRDWAFLFFCETWKAPPKNTVILREKWKTGFISCENQYKFSVKCERKFLFCVNRGGDPLHPLSIGTLQAYSAGADLGFLKEGVPAEKGARFNKIHVWNDCTNQFCFSQMLKKF